MMFMVVWRGCLVFGGLGFGYKHLSQNADGSCEEGSGNGKCSFSNGLI